MISRGDFETLYQLSRKLHQHTHDVPRLMEIILSSAGSMVGVEYGYLITFDEHSGIDRAFVLDSSRSLPTEFWEKLLARGLIGFVYHGQRTILIRDVANDPRWPRFSAVPLCGSAIGLPLSDGERIFGVMMLMHTQIDRFNEASIALLEEVASLASDALGAALAIEARQVTGQYQQLFNDAVVPILLTDIDGVIQDVNRKACDFLGWDRHDLLEHPIATIHPPGSGTPVNGQLKNLQMNEERAFRAAVFGAGRVEIPVIVRVRRLHIDGREIIEWVEQDITAQMELEQLKRDLAAMVYHDLRGPLQTIRGSIHKLAQVLANHENSLVPELLQIGIRGTRQLRRMVDSLLDIQRLEEGRAVLDLQPMEMRVLLADAVQLVQPLAADARQSLKFTLEDGLPLIMLDADMMVRVVVNLLENAVKYTPDGGIINLSARADGERVRITINDSGPGIAPDMRQRIFEKYNRVKYHDAPQGVGLGLAFCRLAVEAHGGEIWVESEPDKGSDFIFTLPVKPAAVRDTSEFVALAVNS